MWALNQQVIRTDDDKRHMQLQPKSSSFIELSLKMKLDNTILLLLLCIWIEGSLTEYQHYYVKSDTSDQCPHDLPCETLDTYVSNESAYFTDNTSFIFLPGTHTLNSNVSIHNVTNVALVGNADLNEGNVTIQCNGSGGLVFQNASHVKLVNLSFVSCGQPLPDSLQRYGETAQAALAFGEVSDLLLDSVSVCHSKGYGVLGLCVHGNFEIVHCLFDSNKGNTHYYGGNAAIQYTDCSEPSESLLNISFSNFTKGSYGECIENDIQPATGLAIYLSQNNISVLLTDVVMEENSNSLKHHCGYGGNLFLHFFDYTSNNVTIERCIFSDGTSWSGGGVGVVISAESSVKTKNYCQNELTIRNTQFLRNKGIVGSGLYIVFELNSTEDECPLNIVNIHNCKFESNILKHKNSLGFSGNGVAVHIISTFIDNFFALGHFQAHFEDCTFTNNSIDPQETQKTNLTLGVTFGVTNSNVSVNSSEFKDNNVSAIGIYRSVITFIGNILIQNNTGINGAGMTLCESSYIVLKKYTNISIFDNNALHFGGGIFIQKECFREIPICFFQFDTRYEKNCTKNSKSVHFEMRNNTADQAGSHIYGGSLDNCYIDKCTSEELYKEMFTIHPNESSDLSAVTSDPREVCSCMEGVVNCTKDTIILPDDDAVFPGEDVTIEVVIVGQLNGTVPGTVMVNTTNTDSKTVCKTCSNITFQVKADLKADYINNELKIAANSFSPLVANRPLIVKVTLKPCPLGFKVSHDNICDCEEILKQKKCDIASKTISRSPPSWIGYNNRTDGEVTQGIIYHQVCPYDYCLDEEVNITSNDSMTLLGQDAQCARNRKGLLCSECEDGFTLSLGTSNCIKCNAKQELPLHIFLFFLSGIIIVAFLLVLDVTYTDGAISGLLFYTSVVGFIFLPSNHRNVITLVISWINLTPGYDYCLYDGMNAYGKAWLRVSFPLYLFIINVVIIVMCRNSRRLARLVGGNIIKVLATLLLLSYTKLLESVVTALSFTAIEYPSNNTTSGRVRKLVWLSDPSQVYFSGKHIPLALVAIVFGLLILAYTLVLLFVQPLQRYSHLRCFSWMAKLKPLMDAYTAPHIINDNCRYWEGLLLLFRLGLAAVFSGNVEGNINTNLIAVSLSCVLLLSIAWSVGGVYKKTYLNILNMSSIVNLATLSLAVSYINRIETGSANQMRDLQRHQNLSFISYTSFSVAALTTIMIVAKQVYVKLKFCYQKSKKKEYQALDTSENMPALRQFPIQP